MSRVGITAEGGLLATDLVERIALGDETVAGQKPKDFGLEAGRLSAEIQAAFSAARVYWEGFKLRRETPGVSPVTVTREAWIYPLFERLGYTLTFQRAAAQVGGQTYAISHRVGETETGTPVHIVAFNQKLDERGELKRSPHALLQEYLNKSDALWGIVTDGRELRLLRNSARSSRPSYIAIDLETILDGNLYNEFALVFRLLHRARLPKDGGNPHDCLLETWYQLGIDEGGRVRDRLRDGVKAALETLGSGFLAHPANTALRAKLQAGSLTDLQLYRELLNLIYRLLFLMVAEERRLLFVPESGEAARHQVYLRWYGIGRLRDRAERRASEDGYGDLWEGLKETFRLFRDEAAAKALALTALNGELFGHDACFDLEDRNTSLHNSDLLDAIRYLSIFEERTGRKKTGVRRRVNYAGLDVEELGSIYESLLDYRPQVFRDPGRFALTAGSQRKETGSYYTPPELVRELIESALVPVMEARRDAAKTREEKERALLSLTICDPAAGSGHFLLAAARRVGRELASIRSGEAEPAPETYRAALRDVIRHCLYAVDKNLLAVDLCKVALWIEGHSPGLPLSFLDHRIRCGDSLVGVFDLDVLKTGVPDDAFKRLTGDDPQVCSELRRRNRQDRAAPLDAYSADNVLADAAREFYALADMPDETPGDVRSKEELYHALIEGEGAVSRLRHACNAWTAAFFAPRGSGQERLVPTTADLRNALTGREDSLRAALINELTHRFRFFHWRLEFPEVFASGGFDAILGNPPWNVSEFKSGPSSESDSDKSTSARETSSSPDDDPVPDRVAAARTNHFFNLSNRFPLSRGGKTNVYVTFIELSDAARSAVGAVGLVTPLGFATDETTANLFGSVVEHNRLHSIKGFENEEKIFPGVHNQTKFCLLTLSPPVGGNSSFIMFARKLEHLSQRIRNYRLSPSIIQKFNPVTHSIPLFRTDDDRVIAEKLYQQWPVIGQWPKPTAPRFKRGFYNTTTDKNKLTKFTLTSGEAEHSSAGIPLYEGKMLGTFDHRFGTYEGQTKPQARKGVLPHVTDEMHQSTEFRVTPRYTVPPQALAEKYLQLSWPRQWVIGWRDVTNSTSERTCVAAALPRVVFDDGISLFLLDGPPIHSAYALALLNTLVFDYLVRQKYAGSHLKAYMIAQVPAPPPVGVEESSIKFIIERVLELSVTTPELAGFASDLGHGGALYGWNPDRRAVIQAELDAYFGYLYGIDKSDFEYILDPKQVMSAEYPGETFRVLKENELAEFEEYRTRRLVLEAWDRFVEDGTFDPARLRDPTPIHFNAVRRALVETRGRVKSLERELQELLARSDATPLPTLFVEGESDVAILTAAWHAFHPTEPSPVTILAAGGTRQMESLAGKGRALRQVLGDRLVFSLADNDREGRELVDDGHVKRGGRWRQQTNGIHWCLLAPTPEFEQAMKRFGIPENFWPFTIENAFPAALRRQAMADGAYAVEEAVIQASFHGDTGILNKALAAAHQLDRSGDDAVLYFHPPAPQTKLAFAEWVTAPERGDRATFAAFRPILEGLRTILAQQLQREGSRGSAAAK